MEHLMSQTCDVYRRAAATADAWGNTDGELAASSSDVPCRLVQRRESLEVEVGGEVLPVQMTCWLPWGTDVAVGDRLLSGSTWYEVVGYNEDVAARSYYFVAWVREVR